MSILLFDKQYKILHKVVFYIDNIWLICYFIYMKIIRNLNFGFTLAEVLITLGIIGVVAGLTLPNLISEYKKHVYYTQFRKAVTVLEQAVKLYALDNGCETNIADCLSTSNFDVHAFTIEKNNITKFSKYFNIAKVIDIKHPEVECPGYEKLPVSWGYGEHDRSGNLCYDDGVCNSEICAFITTDGMLFNFAWDNWYAGENYVDVNGPDKGPNLLGRDIFAFYIYPKSKIIFWGEVSILFPDGLECTPEYSYGCGAVLLKEGKMNY